MRARKVEEVGHELAQQPDFIQRRVKCDSTVGVGCCPHRLSFEQLNVAVNRGQRVFELVGETRCHLSEIRQIVFELHSFAKLDHFGYVGHQAKRAFDVLRGVTDGRDAQTDAARATTGMREGNLFTPKRCSFIEAFRDHRRHPRRRTEEGTIVDNG